MNHFLWNLRIKIMYVRTNMIRKLDVKYCSLLCIFSGRLKKSTKIRLVWQVGIET